MFLNAYKASVFLQPLWYVYKLFSFLWGHSIFLTYHCIMPLFNLKTDSLESIILYIHTQNPNLQVINTSLLIVRVLRTYLSSIFCSIVGHDRFGNSSLLPHKFFVWMDSVQAKCSWWFYNSHFYNTSLSWIYPADVDHLLDFMEEITSIFLGFLQGTRSPQKRPEMYFPMHLALVL